MDKATKFIKNTYKKTYFNKDEIDAIIHDISVKYSLDDEQKKDIKKMSKKKKSGEYYFSTVKKSKITEVENTETENTEVEDTEVEDVKLNENKNKIKPTYSYSETFNSYIDNHFDCGYMTKGYMKGKNKVTLNGIDYTKQIEPKYEPFGTQWVYDDIVDDKITEVELEKTKILLELKSRPNFKQGEDEWFALRKERMTASDCGTVVGVNKHEPPYKFILKKTIDAPFHSNKFCHHGTKYEEIATMVYKQRLGVKTASFGLLAHSTINFLGASPDDIVDVHKFDGIHKTKYVGRMLEIKCPYVRKIQMGGTIIDNICPIYYWVQVQVQLECCDLDECDFWQCGISEYDSKADFLADTHATEPYRSLETGFEKGCLIQLLPFSKVAEAQNKKTYEQTVYDASKHIYPKKIDMTPSEVEKWIADTVSALHNDPEYAGKYYLNRVIYWRVNTSKCIIIYRDKLWFKEQYPTMEKMWNYVLFLRANPDKIQIFNEYVNSLDMKYNKKIMKVVDDICNDKDINYHKTIANLISSTVANNENKKKKNIGKDLSINMNNMSFQLVDDSASDEDNEKIKKNTSTKNKKSKVMSFQLVDDSDDE